MNAILRVLVAVVLAAWVAVPSLGSEGGENAGGTGVWVLPRATFLNSGSPLTGPEEFREEITLANFTKSVHLVLSNEVGAAVGTLVDHVSGAALGLSVLGDRLIIPASLLQSLAASGGLVADVVVADVNQMGYRMRLLLNPSAGTGLIKVY